MVTYGRVGGGTQVNLGADQWLPLIFSLAESPATRKRRQLAETIPMLEQLSKFNLPAEVTGPMVKELMTYQEDWPRSMFWPSAKKPSTLTPPPIREIPQPPQVYTGAEMMYEEPEEGYAPYRTEIPRPPIRREDWARMVEPDYLAEAQRTVGSAKAIADFIAKEPEDKQASIREIMGIGNKVTWSERHAEMVSKGVDVYLQARASGKSAKEALMLVPPSVLREVTQFSNNWEKATVPKEEKPWSAATFEGWFREKYGKYGTPVPRKGTPEYEKYFAEYEEETARLSGAKRKPEEPPEEKLEDKWRKERREDAKKTRGELEHAENAARTDYAKYLTALKKNLPPNIKRVEEAPGYMNYETWLIEDDLGKVHRQRISQIKGRLHYYETGASLPTTTPPISRKQTTLPEGVPEGSKLIGKTKEGYNAYQTPDGKTIAVTP